MPSTSSEACPPLWALADCNNFYASCEQLFRPDLLNRPVVVLSNNDGCIVARSKEAKALGIKMGEPEFKVRCFLKAKGVTVFSSNYALYGDISERVMLTMEGVCPVVEQYSIDEAFLPFDKVLAAHAEDVAWALRKTVKKKTGITISVGVAPTRTLAKVANHLAKRGDGVTVLGDMAAVPEVLRSFPIGEVWGIGRRLAAKLEAVGIRTAYDLTERDDSWIRKAMTITGLRTAYELRGRQAIMLDTAPPPRQTLVTSRSFGQKIQDARLLSEAVSTFTARAAERLRKEGLLAGGLMVFIRTSFFTTEQQHEASGQVTFPQATSDTLTLNKAALKILEGIFKEGPAYAKAGVMLFDLVSRRQRNQYALFPAVTPKEQERRDALMAALDAVNRKMGSGTVQLASMGIGDAPWKMRQERTSPRATTEWSELAKANCK